MDQHQAAPLLMGQDPLQAGSPAGRMVPARSITQMMRAGLITEDDGRTRLGDEFRIAASRVQATIAACLSAGGPGSNLLLITSTRPGEGKSFSAINLASALAQTAPRPVLLIDADAKRGSVSELMGLRGEAGLLDLTLDAMLSPASLVVATPVPGLSVLPLGNHAAAYDAGGAVQPLQAVAQKLCRCFPETTIVIDTGPLLATSDPSVLAPCAGQIVMVVEAARTQRSELEAALDMIHACPQVMLMLNKVPGRSRTSFGAYSYAGDYYARPNTPPVKPDPA